MYGICMAHHTNGGSPICEKSTNVPFFKAPLFQGFKSTGIDDGPYDCQIKTNKNTIILPSRCINLDQSASTGDPFLLFYLI